MFMDKSFHILKHENYLERQKKEIRDADLPEKNAKIRHTVRRKRRRPRRRRRRRPRRKRGIIILIELSRV